MKTRNQAKRKRQLSGEECSVELLHDSDSCSLSSISLKSVGKLLKRGSSYGSPGLKKQNDSLRHCDSIDKLDNESKGKEEQVRYTRNAPKASEAECSIRDEKLSTSSELKVGGVSIQHVNPDLENVMDDLEWEDGAALDLNSLNYPSENHNKGITIEFDASPDTAKRKPVRRASAEEKELAELVHCVHLLCLLGRGRLIDLACSNPLIQASLLSIIPMHLLKITEVPELTAKDLVPLVNWFHNNFRIRSPSSADRSFQSALACALEAREGTPEEVAALSVALFRAINLSTRFVSILDVASLKPDAGKSDSISQVASIPGSGIFNASTIMVDRSNQVSESPIKHSAFDDKETACETSAKGACKSKVNKSTKSIFQHKKSPIENQLNDKRLDSLANEAKSDTFDLTEKFEGSKRKGDFEFEMQLQMALSATSVVTSESNASSDAKDFPSSLSIISPFKKLKRIRGEESSSSSQGISTAVGSRKRGPPLYWAEVYCSGENTTGKWVHVDVVTSIIDGEQKVESAAAACKTSLRYAVAFAGQGAKDVTRRYCAKWYKVASQRVSPTWWDAVLAPLKELESVATGGVIHLKKEALNKLENAEVSRLSDCSTSEFLQDCKVIEGNDEKKSAVSSIGSSFVATRTSLEDLELETKALTEPLPTNQQAYRNHHLYALERWLTKYQILHPKGPILGICSGHPVYPRTCVQELHTRERWLREGRQIKINELPVKELKRSQKLNRTPVSEADDCDDSEGHGGIITLYGKWQTEPLCLPHAVNGIVPKNERGQVDVWSEKCLPPGTVHLGLPRIYAIAKRLEIDYAAAMVGFEFRNGRSIPVYNGIVVCAEFKDAILEAYREEEERRLAEDKRRAEGQAMSRWYQLLSSIVTRQRLENRYRNGASADTSHDIHKTQNKTHEQIAGDREDKQIPECQETNMHDTKLDDIAQEYAEEHEHIFLKDDQSFDIETSTRTKRCHCGFSIEVEDM